MTWWRGKEHYEVFFNRDELKTRAKATPPRRLESSQGARFLAPIDSVANGTWMLTNEYRVTVCLLNRWHDHPVSNTKYRSRGLLVLGLAHCRSAADVIDMASCFTYSDYRPFTLVVIDPEDVRMVEWNGDQSQVRSPTPPLTSSSFRFDEVSARRRQCFHEMSDYTPKELHRYHAAGQDATAYTVRMNRPDAQTWSRSHVSVSPRQIHWEYIEEVPDLVEEGTIHIEKLALENHG